VTAADIFRDICTLEGRNVYILSTAEDKINMYTGNMFANEF